MGSEQRDESLIGRRSDCRVPFFSAVDELSHHRFDECQIQGLSRVLGQEDEDRSRESLDLVGRMIHSFAQKRGEESSGRKEQERRCLGTRRLWFGGGGRGKGSRRKRNGEEKSEWGRRKRRGGKGERRKRKEEEKE